MIEGAERLQINSNSCANAAAQIVGIEAIRGSPDSVSTMVSAFESRTQFLANALNDLPGIRCLETSGAFYVFPNLSETGLESHEMQDRLLAEADIAVVVGTSFGDEGAGYIRISAAAGLDELKVAVGRIGSFLTNLS